MRSDLTNAAFARGVLDRQAVRPVIPTSRDEYHAEVAKLRTDLGAARAAVEYWRGLLMAPLAFPFEWRLTGSETRVLAALVRHPNGLSKPALHHAQAGPGREPESELKIVDVFICKIRGKLRKKFGIEIETLWDAGYRLTPASLAACRAALPQTATTIEGDAE